MKQLEQYVSVLELGVKSSNTIRSYIKDLTKLAKYFGVSDASELENVTVEQYHEFYASQKIEANSIKGLIRNLSAFYTWLEDNKIISKDNSFSHVKFGKNKFPKVSKKRKVILTKEEATALINAGRNLQEKFMFSLMLKTALRREEVCNIKLSDIHGCAISLKSKGGDEDAETYLNKELCQMLNEYLLERNTDSEYLFYATKGFDTDSGKMTGTSVNNRVRACTILAGIPQDKIEATTAHRLRAYALTHIYLEKGREAAQAVARHKSKDTIDLYIVAGNDFVKGLLLGDDE